MKDILSTKYGDLKIDRQDIRDKQALSLDMRGLSSSSAPPREDKLLAAGTFSLSLFAADDGEHPVGEIRLIVKGVEVSLVGHLTGRSGVLEVTPDHLSASMGDDGYRGTLLGWIRGGEA